MGHPQKEAAGKPMGQWVICYLRRAFMGDLSSIDVSIICVCRLLATLILRGRDFARLCDFVEAFGTCRIF